MQMVQHKYFGDSRDYFKYDLITKVLAQSSLRHYMFIPMLTEHRDDGQGNTRSRNRGDKSPELLDFIVRCNGIRSLKHWETWLGPHVQSYRTVEPVDGLYFSDQTRDTYWDLFGPLIGRPDALIFIDPDTGLQSGGSAYRQKQGPERYLLFSELRDLLGASDPSSVLMVYQHLSRNEHHRHPSMEKKLSQIRDLCGSTYSCAYREADLGFLFVAKRPELHNQIRTVLDCYCANSKISSRSLCL